METGLALLAGMAFGSGVYMVLAAGGTKVLVGVSLLAQAMILAWLAAGWPARDAPPLAGSGSLEVSGVSDPSAQVMAILTMVIAIGVTAFALALSAHLRPIPGPEVADTDQKAH